MKPVLALLLLFSFGSAPFQCASRRSERAIEDTPAEAMWNLAERFREQGMSDAHQLTLREIVDDYPESREAERARILLDGGELHAEPTTGSGATPTSADAATSTGASN